MLGTVLFIASGCISGQKETGKQVFEFHSGGAYHLEGYGEWQIKLDTEGYLSISHDVQGKVKDYGTFTLTESENSELWQLIRAMGLETMSFPQRAGMPDEVQYSFSLEDENGRIRSVEIWINDARQNDRIVALVDQIGLLIGQYTGQTPVLK
jgi:hypothetical protein